MAQVFGVVPAVLLELAPVEEQSDQFCVPASHVLGKAGQIVVAPLLLDDAEAVLEVVGEAPVASVT